MRPEIFVAYDANINEMINSVSGVTTSVITPAIFKNNEYLFKVQLYNVYPTVYDVSAAVDWKNGIGTAGADNPLVESNVASFNTTNAATGYLTIVVNTHSTTLDTDLGTLEQKLYSNEIKADNETTVGQFDIFIRNTVYAD
jgi:hypothetical protein